MKITITVEGRDREGNDVSLTDALEVVLQRPVTRSQLAMFLVALTRRAEKSSLDTFAFIKRPLGDHRT